MIGLKPEIIIESIPRRWYSLSYPQFHHPAPTPNLFSEKVMKKTWIFCVITGLVSLVPTLHSQAVYTASKTPFLEVGGGYLYLNSDFTPHHTSAGATAWVDANLNSFVGLEAEGHDGYENAYKYGETSFLVGPRFSMRQGKGSLYAKAMVGRGTLKHEVTGGTSSSYELYAFGAGIDYHVSPSFKVRVVDAEFQTWASFKPNGLTPYAISSGLMYSFH